MEFRSYKGNYVCIESEISADKVLLSDEMDWHFVLNDSYMPSAQNQKEFDRQWESFEHLFGEEKGIAKEKSWGAIFTVSPPHYDEWNQTGRYSGDILETQFGSGAGCSVLWKISGSFMESVAPWEILGFFLDV